MKWKKIDPAKLPDGEVLILYKHPNDYMDFDWIHEDELNDKHDRLVPTHYIPVEDLLNLEKEQ